MSRTGKLCRQIFIRACAGIGNRLRHGCQRPLKQFSDLLVGRFFGHDFVPSKNSTRIGIDYKNWMVAGIEQDGIGSLWADSMQAEEFFAKLRRRTRKQFCQGTFVLFVQKRDEKFKPLSFLAKISSRANQTFKFSQRSPADSTYAEQVRCAQILQSLLNIRPRSVLREISTHNHFKP